MAGSKELDGGPMDTSIGGGCKVRASCSVLAHVGGKSTTGEARGVIWSGDRPGIWETGEGARD